MSPTLFCIIYFIALCAAERRNFVHRLFSIKTHRFLFEIFVKIVSLNLLLSHLVHSIFVIYCKMLLIKRCHNNHNNNNNFRFNFKLSFSLTIIKMIFCLNVYALVSVLESDLVLSVAMRKKSLTISFLFSFPIAFRGNSSTHFTTVGI